LNLDVIKYVKQFGFKARTKFEVGSRKTIEWFTSTQQTQ
jgi:dTDP-D-glucose 4,6-dehydratase